MKKFIMLSFLALLTLSVSTSAQFLEKTTSQEVYTEINAYRVANGLPALEVSSTLEISASVYAVNLNVTGREKHAKLWFATHNRLCAEILGGPRKPVDRWKTSYIHNRILLTKNFTHMGTGMSGGTRVVRFLQRT